jgi:flagellar hook-associated protein 1 FlgK
MIGLYSVLHMAKSSTLTQQSNIGVVGHNIANVTTTGYSRQKLLLEPNHSLTTAIGQMGTGVGAVGVQRDYDKFINAQINFEKQILGNWQAQDDNFKRVEMAFSETSEYGLSMAMNEFWNAWQALADNPGYTERVGLIGVTETMTGGFNKMFDELYAIQSDIDSTIKATVDDINMLVDQIVELNEKIASLELGQNTANDFRDKRYVLLNELASKVGFTSFEDSNGQTTVLLESGNPLIQANSGWHLAVKADVTNNGFYDVGWDDGTGSFTDITGSITRGGLKGLLETRDTAISTYLERIDKLAAGIINEVNKLHYYGYGLDGSTENNFFNPLSVSTGYSKDNTGGASINSGTIYDNTVLTLDDYEIRFTATDFKIFNVTDGTQVMTARISGSVDNDGSFTYASGDDIEFEGIRVAITTGATGPANGDIFTVNSTEGAARNMTVNPVIVSDGNKIAASEGSAGDDNLKALDIAVLGNGKYMNNNTSSFDSYYNGIASEVGLNATSVSRSLLHKQDMVDQMNTRRESISGVNLDEEMANLMMYQQAYTAAARMISVVQEMLDELVDIV